MLRSTKDIKHHNHIFYLITGRDLVYNKVQDFYFLFFLWFVYEVQNDTVLMLIIISESFPNDAFEVRNDGSPSCSLEGRNFNYTRGVWIRLELCSNSLWWAFAALNACMWRAGAGVKGSPHDIRKSWAIWVGQNRSLFSFPGVKLSTDIVRLTHPISGMVII